MKAQKALESGTHVNIKEAKNLNAYFHKVSGMSLSFNFFTQGPGTSMHSLPIWLGTWLLTVCYTRPHRAATSAHLLPHLHTPEPAHTSPPTPCPATPLLQVKQTQGKFEERLWSIVRNFLEVSRSDPDLLVAALQAVELQEMVDAQLLAAGQGGCLFHVYLFVKLFLASSAVVASCFWLALCYI